MKFPLFYRKIWHYCRIEKCSVFVSAKKSVAHLFLVFHAADWSDLSVFHNKRPATLSSYLSFCSQHKTRSLLAVARWFDPKTRSRTSFSLSVLCPRALLLRSFRNARARRHVLSTLKRNEDLSLSALSLAPLNGPEIATIMCGNT